MVRKHLFLELDIQVKMALKFIVIKRMQSELWKAILEAGKEFGILPIGLGARDTLRFEAKLALYGQEFSPEISPLEAGIGFAVKLNKEADFIGKEALKKQKENGVPRKLSWN